jgi:hypothetical protein
MNSIVSTISVMGNKLELRKARDDVMNQSFQLTNLGLCRGDAVVDLAVDILARG